MGAGQILCGKVSHATRVHSAVAFYTFDETFQNAVTHGKRKGEIKIPFCSDLLTPSHDATKVVVDRFFDFLGAMAGANFISWIHKSVYKGSIAMRIAAKANTLRAKRNATIRTRRCSNLIEALAKKRTVANNTVLAR